MRLRHVSLAVAFACGAATAGTANVSFVDPTQYTDAGVTAEDRQQVLASLARHMETLGLRVLPPNQQLQVEVLDVDLAGKLRPTRFDSSGWMRVARAGVDWPRMHVRYTLLANGQPLRSGDEQVKDQDFAGGMGIYASSTPLFHEKRMLSRWFRERFGGQLQAAR